MVDQLRRAGAEIEAAQEMAEASYRRLGHDFTEQNRRAAAAAVARKRRLIHQLRSRIAARPGPDGTEEARALTVKALKLWEEGLAVTETSLKAKKARKRRAAHRAAGRRCAKRRDRAFKQGRSASWFDKVNADFDRCTEKVLDKADKQEEKSRQLSQSRYERYPPSRRGVCIATTRGCDHALPPSQPPEGIVRADESDIRRLTRNRVPDRP